MDIFMASAAGGGSAFKGNQRWPLADHRLMAFQATHGTVCTQQVELRFRVIERGRFLPGADVVASFAALLRVGCGVGLVGIAMALAAGCGIEVISLGGRPRGLL